MLNSIVLTELNMLTYVSLVSGAQGSPTSLE